MVYPTGVLSLYLTTQLGFDEDSATVIYHVFSALTWLTPLLGGFISDQFLGKFKSGRHIRYYICRNLFFVNFDHYLLLLLLNV